ncbi:MAG TPA: DEAD/DEAH box helicase family protein, partial [Ktedonobacteraceae bacterium]|nr:DEAD/DEAH box helicase family protein [Ktedonobacteraceae bacterium]
MITIELRGRDLLIISPTEWRQLPLVELLTMLFGPYLPIDVSGDMVQDKRGHFLRTKPIYFSMVKQALSQQQTPFTVSFEERPALPFTTTPAMEPRPYQQEALNGWLAKENAGVVVLPTGAGKTFVAAMAIHETGLWTLA